jgi:hypothetical protein
MCVAASATGRLPATCSNCPHGPNLDRRPSCGFGPRAEASAHCSAASPLKSVHGRPAPQEWGKATGVAFKIRVREIIAAGLLALWPAGAFGEPAKGLEGRHHGW